MLLLLCSICSELMKPVDAIYVTRCGHLFHYQCLRKWIRRSRTCPHCRNVVTTQSIFRVYPTEVAANSDHTVYKLQMDLDQTVHQLNEKKLELLECHKEIEEKNTKLKKTEGALMGLEEIVKRRDSDLAASKEQIKYLKNENNQLNQVKEELTSAKTNLLLLEGLQKVFNDTVIEVENMLKDYHDLRTVATFAAALKKALFESESNNTNLKKRLRASKRELAKEKKKNEDLQSQLLNQQETVMKVQKKNDLLKDQFEVKSNSSDRDKDESVLDKENESLILQKFTRKTKADSPYLNVKQSNPAWAAIMEHPSTSKGGPLKPLHEQSSKVAVTFSKGAVSKAAGPTLDERHTDTLSIFRKKAARYVKFWDDDDTSKSETNLSYDGLGGHSSTSEASPKKKTKCAVPKLTAKRKLKRPSTDNTQNMKKYFKSLDK